MHISVNRMGWSDRLALINFFNPSIEQACKIFNVSKDEIEAAQDLQKTGAFTASDNLKMESYASLFNNPTSIASTIPIPPPKKRILSPGIDNTSLQPMTATKPTHAPQKRGRKGNNIATAFKSIPHSPVDLEQFANTHSVSVAVLRQAKRFDPVPETGRVKVRKDKQTDNLTIWREANPTGVKNGQD